MALTFPALLAALVWAAGEVVWTPHPPVEARVVSRVVNDTAARMAARRGVRLTRPLLVRLVDRSQMQAARSEAAAEAPVWGQPPLALAPRALRDALYAHLGLMAAGGPGLAAEVPPGPVEITGLCDLRHGQLLLANWSELGGQGRFALARDVAETLLDRRFDLARWLTPPRRGQPGDDDSDARLARQALVSGDATVQALEDLDPEGDLPSPRALAAVVEQVRAAIEAENEQGTPDLQRRLFVELDGLTFVQALRARAPWTAVDQVWRRPPQSTEHILHPGKYARAERSVDVGARLAPRSDARWPVIHGDTLGEWGTRLFLARAGDAYRATRAATGWGGDRALLFRLGPAPADGPAGTGDRDSAAGPVIAWPSPSPASLQDTTFAAWITVWDDESDADDFAAQALASLASLARVPVADAHPVAGRVRLADAAGRLFLLDHQRRTVGLVMAAPPEAQDLLARLMAAATSSSPSPVGPRRDGRAQSPARPR